MLKIEKLEDERQKKEVTKKDSELFLKNLDEIDLILKHFINGNPDDLNWDKVDIKTQNFDLLFPIESQETVENNQDSSFQRNRQRNPTIAQLVKGQSGIDVLQEKKPSSGLQKYASRDQIVLPTQKKTQILIALPEIQFPKVSQNQIVEKVNKFMRFHQLTPEQIYEKFASSYHQLILTEVTLKNRLSSLMDEREDLILSLKNYSQNLEDLLKNANLHQFLSKYENKFQQLLDGSESENYEKNTINQLIQQQQDTKVHELQLTSQQQTGKSYYNLQFFLSFQFIDIYEKLEKFVSFMFYQLNELIFRWCSFISSITNLSSQTYKEESRLFIEQVKIKKEFSKKIINLIQNFYPEEYGEDEIDDSKVLVDQIPKIENKISENEDNKSEKSLNGNNSFKEYSSNNKQLNVFNALQQFQKDILEQYNDVIDETQIQIIYKILRNDFILYNFLIEQQLKSFLNRIFLEYKSNKDTHPNNPFEQLSSYFLDNLYELKNEAEKTFKNSLNFLTDSLFNLLQDTVNEKEFLNQLIENEKLEILRNQQLQSSQQMCNNQSDQIISFVDPLAQSQMLVSQINNNSNFNVHNIPVPIPPTVMQKKLFRRRIIMMKCREFNDYYGFEVHRKQTANNAAQTIIDVIYETLYDLRHGNQTDIFDMNQEINFFIKNRNNTKSIEKEKALKIQEEERKREEEQKAKEKQNKTYLMKPQTLEFNEEQNKYITLIEKKFNLEIKENDKVSSTTKNKYKLISEKQQSEIRNKIIQKMRSAYSSFHTKYQPISLANAKKDGDANSPDNQNSNNNHLKQRKKTFLQKRNSFNRSQTQNSTKLYGDQYNQNYDYENNYDDIPDFKIKYPYPEKQVQFFDQKKEKQSIFKSSQMIQIKTNKPESINNEDYPFTDRAIQYNSKTYQNEYLSPLSINEKKSKFSCKLILFNDRQDDIESKSEDQSIQLDEELKSENEKQSEQSIEQMQILKNQVDNQTQKEIKKSNIAQTQESCRKPSLKLNIQSNIKIQDSKKRIKLNQLKPSQKPNHLLRHSLDKLIKIPTPLAPLILNKNEIIPKNKLETNSKAQRYDKQAFNCNYDALIIEKNNQQFQPNQYFSSDYTNISKIYNDLNSQRQAYLVSRQSKSTNSYTSLVQTYLPPNNFYFTNYEI